jgi:hypothetical protein
MSTRIRNTNRTGTSSKTVNRNTNVSNTKVIIKTSQGSRFVTKNVANARQTEQNKKKSFTGTSQRLGGTPVNLLNGFTSVQLRMFYVNTYNTLAYFSGQYVDDIDDGEVLRYVVFLELIINKLNRKSGQREKELTELWNKSLDMQTTSINHDRILTRYRKIMESGFISNGGNVSSILNNAKK